MGCGICILVMIGLVLFRAVMAGMIGYLIHSMFPGDGGSMLYDLFLIGIGMLIYKCCFANRQPPAPAGYAYPYGTVPPPQPPPATAAYGPGIVYPAMPAAPR